MRAPRPRLTSLRPALAAALFVATLAGCSSDKGGIGPVVTPDPENSTPLGALARFERKYEDQSLAAYGPLFTSDFSFRFSAEADPLLAAQYGTSWGIDDEIISTGHLFDGFTQADPPFESFGPATVLTMTLIDPQVLADSTHADSTAHYKLVVVPTVDLEITVVIGSIESIYEVSAPHDFYVVRGDAALLASGQPADSLHWYIRRWDDRAPAFNAMADGNKPRRGDSRLHGASSAAPATWGNIKATYRR